MGGILGIIVLVLDIVAILDIVKSAKTTTQKLLWVLIVLVLPFVGMIAYFLIGKKQ